MKLIETYTMMHAWSISQSARTIEYGHQSICYGYDTSYNGLGTRVSNRWMEELIVII